MRDVQSWGEQRTFEARGVISTLMSWPSSSWRGLNMAAVCWRLEDDVNVLLAPLRGRDEDLPTQPLRITVNETQGSKKSRTGSGVLCRCLRGARWRNARAADDEVAALRCEQLLVIHRAAMVVRRRYVQTAEMSSKSVGVALRCQWNFAWMVSSREVILALR
jgi:hypothetical protein